VPARAPNARYLKASFQARPRARRPARQARHAVHAVSGLPGAAASTGITPTITELAAALETGQQRLGPQRLREPWPPCCRFVNYLITITRVTQQDPADRRPGLTR
jgi:hypothetical protein